MYRCEKKGREFDDNYFRTGINVYVHMFSKTSNTDERNNGREISHWSCLDSMVYSNEHCFLGQNQILRIIRRDFNMFWGFWKLNHCFLDKISFKIFLDFFKPFCRICSKPCFGVFTNLIIGFLIRSALEFS